MNHTEGKPLSDHSDSPFEETSSPKWVAWNDSRPHLMGNLCLPSEVSELEQFNSYHLTARVVNKELTTRHLSLILEVLMYQIVYFGCNFAMYLTMIELYQRILGQKREADEINDGKIRLTALLSELIIREFKGNEFSLDSKEYLVLSGDTAVLLKQYLMSKRTYGSRYKHWRPERWIRIRAVPVVTVFERSKYAQTEKYSGYTKGYGESHPSAHRKKTKPSYELDGDRKRSDSEQRNLFLRMFDPVHQLANMLWIKYKNLERD